MIVSCIVYWKHVLNISTLLSSDLLINKTLGKKEHGLRRIELMFATLILVAFGFAFASAVALAIPLYAFLPKSGSTKLIIKIRVH
jgi:hypothetical protein